MKRKFFLSALAVVTLVGGSAFANEKIDWGVCKADIAAKCSGKKDDHETHECLEKQNDVSKACKDFNHKLESKFKGKHEHKGDSH